MTAKEYLSQIKALDMKINQRIEEAETLRQIAAGLRSPVIKGDPVQTSPDGDSIGRIVNRYLDIENEINAMIDEYVNLKHKIIGKIQDLKCMQHSNVLYERYVEYKPLYAIASEMHYSYSHIKRLHKNALKAFERRYPMIL